MEEEDITNAAPEKWPTVCNLEAEAALLGAILQGPDHLDYASDKLRPEMFFEPCHARIFEAAVHQHSLGKAVNPVTLKQFFEHDDALKELGGPRYLAHLTADIIGFVGFHSISDQLVELYQRRVLQEALRTGIQTCHDMRTQFSEITAEIDTALMSDTADSVHEVNGKQCFDELFASFDEDATGITCDRIPSIDKLIGPLRPKQLLILAARPGIGKTAVALSYAIGAAQRGHGVLFISLEMSSVELAARMGADLCFTGDGGVPFSRIRDNRLSTEERQQLSFAGQRFATHPFQLVDAGSLTVGRVRRLVRRHKRRMAAQGNKLELVVVDYLQLLSPDQRARSAYEAISEISRTLKQIAKDENVAIMALAQLSREVEKRPDKRPQLSDLRDSGQIEQDADIVLFLTRQEYYHRMVEPHPDAPEWPQWKTMLDGMQGEIEFISAKRRNGRTGNMKGIFAGAYQAVRG